MKWIINTGLCVSLWLFGLPVFAQQGMDMSVLMEQMEQLERCLSSVDQSELDRIEQDGAALEQELKTLCAAGKAGRAQQKALDFSREVAASKAMQQILRCTDNLGEFAQFVPSPLSNFEQFVEDRVKSESFCAGLR